jgi:hypothetical protein
LATVDEYTLHRLSDHISESIDFIQRNIEDELIVDLEDHGSPEILCSDLSIDPDHRELDHISSRSLDRHIHRLTLCD